MKVYECYRCGHAYTRSYMVELAILDGVYMYCIDCAEDRRLAFAKD
mgnify:CR=1 FL=1